MPDLAALDLEADDAGALDRDDEVDLVVLEVVGDALAGDDEVVGLELIDQHLPDAPLGRVGEAGRFGDGDAQGSEAPRLKPLSHLEPSPLLALASRDVDDAIDGGALFGGDSGEDFEDVGGLLDDIGVVCGEEFGDFFEQLVAQGSAVIVRS